MTSQRNILIHEVCWNLSLAEWHHNTSLVWCKKFYRQLNDTSSKTLCTIFIASHPRKMYDIHPLQFNYPVFIIDIKATCQGFPSVMKVIYHWLLILYVSLFFYYTPWHHDVTKKHFVYEGNILAQQDDIIIWGLSTFAYFLALYKCLWRQVAKNILPVSFWATGPPRYLHVGLCPWCFSVSSQWAT